ncbi:hypothetical protein [Streptomyces sp. NPDC059970]|uniref:hypothetical protein n=1 Tax=Streptomyces sp. NPDC059970 TaxID=3347019 RepID=UPI003692F1E1
MGAPRAHSHRRGGRAPDRPARLDRAEAAKAPGYQDFKRYLDVRYIGNHDNPPRGEAFKARMVKKYYVIGPNWLVPGPDRVHRP